ncbi:hypothetical protein BVY01_04920 [bacterium I07]|nr:hypothetical protein BVY01_04920 [bacterium I07]
MVGELLGQSVYRVRLPHKDWSAKLVGVTGTVTQGIEITGTYDTKFGAHEFLVTTSGGYDLYVDPDGGTSWSLDTDWDAGQSTGKVLVGTDWGTTIYMDPDGNLIVQPGSDNDGDIYLIDASGDSTMLSTENSNGHTYLEHYRGKALNLSGWWGNRGNVRILGNLMVLTHIVGDTVFAVWSDSTTGYGSVKVKGDGYVGPDVDGDGEWWFINADGDSGLIDMDHNPRVFSLQHPPGSYLWLSGKNGYRGKTYINGNFFVMRQAYQDTLFSVVTDSAGNVAQVNVRGEGFIGPDADGDGEWHFVNSDGDSARIDLDHNPRAFYVQHPANSQLWLTSWNGYRGNVHVNGNLYLRQHASGDTLFSMVTDSTNNTATVTAGGGIGIRKWMKIGTHLAFITMESDTFYCSAVNDSTSF